VPFGALTPAMYTPQVFKRNPGFFIPQNFCYNNSNDPVTLLQCLAFRKARNEASCRV